ncbi:MAG: LLM class flavin-dependent oxidoreductase [Rhodospirillales bacterium]|nr:LLM class flavin-dependent oxidoreductase [Rhodospirillales bacterium]
MKFGIFDHVDRSDVPLTEQFQQRIQYIQAAEKAGFYCYHVAEHHATPLNMVPVPGVFLGAVAQATSTIKLGPLVYLLPLYSPLRLIEEIAILDHLSNGRMQIGVGRGVSPFELNFHNVDPETAREVFLDGLEAVIYGMTHDMLDHDGKHFQYKDVPMELKPKQQDPHPPIWYPSSTPANCALVAEMGYNFVTLGSREHARTCLENFREGITKRNGKPGLDPNFPDGMAQAINRHIIIADTDEKALEIARPAYKRYHYSLAKLWRENKVPGPAIASLAMDNVEAAIENGSFIAGSPDTVGEEMERQIAATGINYFICDFYFGDISHEDAMGSLDRFSADIMPGLSKLQEAAE